ncbi:sulfotransferase [Bradyrhizobium ontarionense]|uniref:Sulfotransferase n=1 Tax=Bradyrhizobium ontarionense TaxID=2898149 RepID=A0ABY3RE00_9BRAD|nr:sulfotransferase [Bradyrhizobium sp. A19]UFZ04923.1 sulfotransferase [Bradyrhizobium sp. A19]
MRRGTADPDETIVVAPEQRSPKAAQLLTMLLSLDRELGARGVLDVDQFLDLAQSRVGPVSLGARADLHLEGIRRLADSIGRDPYYDDLGRYMASHYIYGWIERYVQFEQDLADFPDIVDVPVAKPLFLIGFGRTGSTFLHHLLALDPRARAPLLWELQEPSPPPRPETYATDPRIGRVRSQSDFRSAVMPDLHKIHEFAVQAPEECQHMMWHGPQHSILGLRSPDYWQWFRNLSPSQLHELYAGYKRQVQHLQLFHRGGHWVSKSLAHAHFLPVLSNVFPDARIVRLHRDPCQIIPALASLIAHLQIPYTARSDFHDLGRRMLDLFEQSMDRMMQADKEVSSDCLVDVLFDDLTRDPIGTVRAIYAKFGYDDTAEFETLMRRHLKTESVSRRFKHVYTLEQFGLSRAQVMARSEAYLSWLERRTGARLCRP